MEDRRRTKRFDLSQITVWWKAEADKDKPDVTFRPAGTLVDFSPRGLGVVTNENLKEGDSIIIRVGYGKRQIRAEGRVVRRKRLAGRGFEVGIELGEAGQNFILNLIVKYYRMREVYRAYAFAAAGVAAAGVGFLLGVLLS